jgi:outer membrane protein insertion porin family
LNCSKFKYILFLPLAAVMLSGCMGLRHLQEGEKLLAKQEVKAPRGINREAVRSLYVRNTNRTILGTGIKPLVALYYGVWGTQSYNQEKYVRKRERVEKKFDDKINSTTSQKKINNYQFRRQKKLDRLNSFIENGNLWMQWGEPIAVYDSAAVVLTEERIGDYLFSNGYFRGSVTSEVKIRGARGRIVEVSYLLEPGRPYRLDSIAYEVTDSLISKILQDHMRASHIRRGDRFNQDNFTRERERIDLLMKEYGYYDFSRQYIEYEVDTVNAGPDKLVGVRVIINDPERRGYHKQFAIDSVQFTTDASVARPGRARKSRMYRDIHFQYFDDNYNLKILSQRVFLQPGELYSRTKTLNTQRQLANVDAFKFINISFDSTGGKFVANIYSSPSPRYEWSNEAGVNVTQGFPGPFYSISFRKRNLFKGLETFELSGRFGFEGVASVTREQNIYKSTEAGVNASFTFPQFLFPFPERTRFRLAKYNPKTRLTTGYAFTDRPEYRRTAVSLNGTYTWQNNRNLAYSLTPLNISVIDTANLSTDFRNLLQQQLNEFGNFSLVNSFSPSFVNSVIFGLIWNKNNYGNIERNSKFLRTQLETGGTIWNFVDPEIVTRFDLQYFKYIRLSADYRVINVINPTTTFAYRINTGVAYSYADNKSLPYEKFFFAGGSNSIRAWRPRRLGPGSLKPPESGDPVADGRYSYAIEKPAEILLEGSAELRKKLFGFVSGALFIDAGNVWTFENRTRLSPQQQQGNPQFRFSEFYREIAVGTGFGLRFDFTFLILRFDVGIKMIDPARDEGDRFVLDKVKFWRPYARETGENTYTGFREPVIYNVGIGYSF